jgi:ribonuclease P protein component
VYAAGRRLAGRFVVVFAVPRAGLGDRLGVTATRKVGGAVVRNRAKRRVREVFRRWTAGRSEGQGVDVVVNVSERAAKAPAAAVREELLGLLARAGGGRT